MEYRPRIVDRQLQRKLKASGAVQIIGPKWCGKTTTAEQVARSSIYMQDPDNRERYRQIAELKVSLLLEGENPRLIDEWQTEPRLWDAVRMSVDRRQEKGLYILTGSVVVARPDDSHSGAGRIAKLVMRTMSLYESGDSSGEVSLGGLFEPGYTVEGSSDIGIEDVAGLVVRGGWPGYLDGDGEGIEDYCQAILDAEIQIDGVRRNRGWMESIMRSLSRNISTQAPNTTILADIGGEDVGMTAPTLAKYLAALRDVCMTEDMPAWSPHLRSKSVIRTSDTRYLSDPAIAAYFLGATAKDLVMDPETLGLLFECMAVRDLRVYAQANRGRVFHYRDNTGLEADCVISLWNGRWGAVEIKLGLGSVDAAAENLLKLRDRVDTDRMGEPAFLAVVTSTGFAYTRPDGVHVVPIGCLRDRWHPRCGTLQCLRRIPPRFGEIAASRLPGRGRPDRAVPGPKWFALTGIGSCGACACTGRPRRPPPPRRLR